MVLVHALAVTIRINPIRVDSAKGFVGVTHPHFACHVDAYLHAAEASGVRNDVVHIAGRRYKTTHGIKG